MNLISFRSNEHVTTNIKNKTGIESNYFNTKVQPKNTINSYELFNLFCIYTLRPNALLKYIEL